MLLEFFHNCCVLIAIISFVHLLIKNKNMILVLTIKAKIYIGIGCGILGIILLNNSVHITPEIIIDFRYIPIFLAALFAGPLPSIISALIIGTYRLFFMGISMPSILAFAVAMIEGIGFGIIVSIQISKIKKMIYMGFLFITVTSVVLYITLQGSSIVFQTVLMFLIGNFIVCGIAYHYTNYIVKDIMEHDRLKFEATKDYLTGLSNPRQFDRNFRRMSQLTIRQNQKLSIILIDIDFFKKVNDEYGHIAGDTILKEVANILIKSCRVYDEVSRNGGEEFRILLFGCSSQNAYTVAERIRKEIEEYEFSILESICINITISIGISTYTDTVDQIDKLISTADAALYEAKNTGRNRVAPKLNY